MFSAGGLLCLAQFARLTAVLGLVRTLNRERASLIRELASAAGEQHTIIARRCEGLTAQAERVLLHARTVRNACRFLVAGILMMVACSLTIGASLLIAALEAVALGLFILGLVAIFVGLSLVLSELRVSLDEVTFEHQNLLRIHEDAARNFAR